MKSLLTLVAACSVLAFSVAAATAPRTYAVSATTRDGRNDFNFEFGTWRTHYRLLKDRLVGSHDWYDCYGTSVIRPFWSGSGNLEDGDLKCPTRYVGGMTLRTYNTSTHQWTLWWGTRELGISPPPQVGHFDARGVGRFYAYDNWKGTPIICRFQWTLMRGNPHFEQAFSTDGGKSWEVNWTTDYERASPQTKGVWNAVDSANDGHAGSNFQFGNWKTHIRRLQHILANDQEWHDCASTSTVRSFWGGAGDLQDIVLRCPSQDVRALALRLYDAQTRQWRMYVGTDKAGLDPIPEVGRSSR